MYPHKPNDYYEPQSSPVATGIPISSTGQFYNPSAFPNQSQGPVPSTFQTQSQGPVPNSVTAFQSQPQRLVPWSAGLCGCCDDCGNCCLTCLCPCITFGQIAEIVDKGSTSCGASGALYALIVMFTGCGCLYSCLYRSKMRAQYSLLESPCSDCIVHCCCEMCALCQEYRELKRLGFDMSIGWHANMERQGRAGVTVPPAMQGGMSRY